MNIDVKSLSQKALESLTQMRLTQNTVWTYKQYGFKPILDYFEEKRITDYSKDVINKLLSKFKDELDQGNLMRWKWQKIRKAANFLDCVYQNKELNMKPLVSWEIEHNPLRQAPDDTQLENSDNIVVLVHGIKGCMSHFNLSHNTLKRYNYYGFDHILRLFKEKRKEVYNEELINQFMNEQNRKFENNELNQSSYQIIRKVVFMIDEYRNTGAITWRHQPCLGTRFVNPANAKLWANFEKEHIHVLSQTSISTIKSAVHRFMLILERKNIYDFRNVLYQTVSHCVTEMAENYTGGQNALLYSLRTFLRFLKNSGVTDIDLSVAVPKLAAPRRRILSGFTDNEIKKLLDSPDMISDVGKRDYAIMTIAIQTGLRAIDIKNLKYENIDWYANEIRIVQHKTNRPLSLPLKAESGNALADYILNGRPESDLPYIFLCVKPPFRSLSNYTISHIVAQHMVNANIPKDTRRGSHSFRRTFGKGLLESEVSADMLSELLGHTNLNSAKPYFAINEKELKLCGLSICSVEKAGEVL